MTNYAATMYALRAFVCGILIGGTTACQDLDVTNQNDPDRIRALANPGDVESLIATSWVAYWEATQSEEDQTIPLAGWGSEGAGTFANWSFLEFVGQPRRLFDNAAGSAPTETSRQNWEGLYSGLSSANEGLAIIAEGMNLDEDGSDGPATLRGRAFAKFVQGLTLGYIGMLFDQGWIATEDDVLDVEEYLGSERGVFVPYVEVLDQAIASMEEAIALAESGDFTIPWIWGNDLSNQDLVQLANSFMARFLVYGARTPEERAQIDWDAVIAYTENGIAQDFMVDPTSFDESLYKFYTSRDDSFSMWADGLLVGPADVSGAYQTWLETPLFERSRFLITTPDRRITGVDDAGNPDPGAPGKYFINTGELNGGSPERGPYLLSYYKLWRWRTGLEDTDDAWYEDAPLLAMSVDEMRLLQAEAYLRKGDAARAAELINVTRVANGELPPVTAAGVPAQDCVPRMRDGSCGDLLNALMYERMIEGAGLEGPRTWLDSRGFGRLIEGTALHLPVPGRELENLALGYYTFGGVGGVAASTYAGGEANWP